MSGPLAVGDELPPLVKAPIDRVQLVRYAGASGDFNPMHFDADHARAFGYPGVFAHGMLIMGFLGELVASWAETPTRVLAIATRFRAITWPGDVITCCGRVTALGEDRGRKVADLSIEARDAKGELKADGTARVALSD